MTCGLAPAFLIASAIASSKPCDMRGFGRRGLTAPEAGGAGSDQAHAPFWPDQSLVRAKNLDTGEMLVLLFDVSTSILRRAPSAPVERMINRLLDERHAQAAIRS
jgi:hypothetical protein